jgi:hypothetical protein
MTQIEQTRRRRDTARSQATYDVYLEIDCDCEELLDACGLDYTRVKETDALGNQVDSTQNEVALHLDKDYWSDFKDMVNWSPLDTNEQLIGAALLNDELSEYVTKATIYKPNGDKICFS